MPRYAQANYTQKLLNCSCSNTTISSGGCALVSMTQVANSFAGYEKYTVTSANNLLKNYMSCGMGWSTGATKLGFALHATIKTSYNSALESAVETHLDAGRRMIVRLEKSNGASHYVAPNGTFYYLY